VHFTGIINDIDHALQSHAPSSPPRAKRADEIAALPIAPAIAERRTRSAHYFPAPESSNAIIRTYAFSWRTGVRSHPADYRCDWDDSRQWSGVSRVDLAGDRRGRIPAVRIR
jgi:hypothetical protein